MTQDEQDAYLEECHKTYLKNREEYYFQKNFKMDISKIEKYVKENLSDQGSMQSERLSTSKANTISKNEYDKLDAEKIFGNKKKDHIDKFAAGEITFDEFDEIQ